MKKLIPLLVFLCLIRVLVAQQSQTVNVTTAGTLSTLCSSFNTTVTNLTVTGNINTNDMYYMRDNMPLLSVLDLSGASFSTNTLSAYSFYNGTTSKTSLTSVVLPSTIVAIGDKAFYGCSGLTSVTLPSTLTTLGTAPFKYCTSLSSITLPSSITTMGNGAFNGCTLLKTVNIQCNPATWSDNTAFTGCSPTTVTVYNGTAGNLSTLGGSTRFNFLTTVTNLTVTGTIDQRDIATMNSNMTVLASLNLAGATIATYSTYLANQIPASSFSSKTSLVAVSLPSSATSIGSSAFSACTGISSIILPNNINNIGGYAFSGCTGLSSLTLPAGLTTIGDQAFKNCSNIAGSVELPSGFTTIGSQVFTNDSKITSITLPSSLSSIGAQVFYNCPGLTTIFCKNSIPPTLAYSVFGGTTTNVTSVFVPDASAEAAYEASSAWTAFFSAIVIKGPTINGNFTSNAFNTTYGTSSAIQSFSISGTYLTADITATAPTGFEVSSDGINYGTTATFTQSTGNVSGTLRVRLAANAPVIGMYNSKNIVLSSAGATSVNVSTPASGNTVTAKPLTIGAATIASKVYDGNAASGAVTPGTLEGFVGTETVTVSAATGTYADANVGTGKIATIVYTLADGINGGLATNYSLVNGTANGDITAASEAPTGDNLSNSGLTDEQLANTNLTISSGEFIIDATKTVRSLIVAPGAKLTHNSGTLTAINGITLESDAAGTATLMDSYIEPTITATVKQYVTAGRNWYLSAPLNNTADYSVLDKGVMVAEYNEVTGLWPTVSSGTLTRGKGYVQVASVSQGTTGIISFTGTTNSGNVAVTLTNTLAGGKGFNLVGNPYPSYLSWSAVAADNAAANMPTGTMWYRTVNYNGKSSWTPNTFYNLNDIVYNGTRFYKATVAGTSAVSGGPTGSGTGIVDNGVVWNYEGSIYIFATINASGVATPATVSNLVPPMQAFWIKSSGGTLTFKNSMRSHNTGGANTLKAPKNPANDIKLLRLSVSNGASTDEAVIYASSDASNAIDTYDAPKYFNVSGSNQPEIYTLVGTEKLVINAMSNFNQGTEIPLGFTTEKGNSFSISATELKNVESDLKVILKDKQYNSEFDLTSGQSYAFSSSAETSTDRFSLIFRAQDTTTGVNNSTKQNMQVFVNETNQITIIAPKNYNYSVYNALGQKQYENVLNTSKIVIDKAFDAGIYFVELLVNGQREIQKVIIR